MQLAATVFGLTNLSVSRVIECTRTHWTSGRQCPITTSTEPLPGKNGVPVTWRWWLYRLTGASFYCIMNWQSLVVVAQVKYRISSIWFTFLTRVGPEVAVTGAYLYLYHKLVTNKQVISSMYDKLVRTGVIRECSFKRLVHFFLPVSKIGPNIEKLVRVCVYTDNWCVLVSDRKAYWSIWCTFVVKYWSNWYRLVHIGVIQYLSWCMTVTNVQMVSRDGTKCWSNWCKLVPCVVTLTGTTWCQTRKPIEATGS